MNKRRTSWLKCVMLLAILAVVAAGAAAEKPMPKEDVVEVPAIGQGLCVANVFQSNTVLQRDKPLNIWGWADLGEEVTVSFGGQQAPAKAAADRSWQVTLKLVPARSIPQTMSVGGTTVETWTPEDVLRELHSRYAWARNPMGNLVNNRGVPLAAQRSDDWILEETPVKIATPKDMPE